MFLCIPFHWNIAENFFEFFLLLHQTAGTLYRQTKLLSVSEIVRLRWPCLILCDRRQTLPLHQVHFSWCFEPRHPSAVETWRTAVWTPGWESAVYVSVLKDSGHSHRTRQQICTHSNAAMLLGCFVNTPIHTNVSQNLRDGCLRGALRLV